MKRILFVIFILPVLLFADNRPVVQIDPVTNLSGEPWLDSVCAAATDSISLTLGLLRRFDTRNEEFKPIRNPGPDELKQRAENRGFDNIIFGSCSVKEGAYVLSMSAYDLSKNKITYSGQVEVASIYDTFDAVDRITHQTIDGFSGIHVTYSSLTLIPPETEEPFQFTLDGVSLGEGVYSLEKIPSGIHELIVYQDRPLGPFQSVHSLEVTDGKENIYPVPLESAIESERAVLSEADREMVRAGIQNIKPGGPAVAALNNLLSSGFYQKYRPDIIRKYHTALHQAPSSQSDKKRRLRNTFQSRLWTDERLKNVRIYDFSLSTRYPFNSYQALAGNSVAPQKKSITIDGKSEDWKNVPAAFTDKEGDVDQTAGLNKKSLDITEIKAAVNSKYLFLMMRTASPGFKSQGSVYSFHLGDNPVMLIHYEALDNDLWVNRYYSHSNNNAWDSLSGRIRKSTGEVYELAIPIDTLIETYGSSFELESNTVFHGGSSPWKEIDRIDYSLSLILPVVQLKIEDTGL